MRAYSYLFKHNFQLYFNATGENLALMIGIVCSVIILLLVAIVVAALIILKYRIVHKKKHLKKIHLDILAMYVNTHDAYDIIFCLFL